MGSAHIQSRFKCNWIEFVRPDSYWPYPYSLEQAFETFRWMMERGLLSRTSTDWAKPGVTELLSCQPTCTSFTPDTRPICDGNDLKARFHYALLGRGHKKIDEWRAKHRIGVGETRFVVFPHYKPLDGPTSEHVFRERLAAMLKAHGASRTAVQLNPVHADAVEVGNVRFALVSCGRGRLKWTLRLNYGVDRSSWVHTVARQGDGERFWDFAWRANDELLPLLDVDLEPDE